MKIAVCNLDGDVTRWLRVRMEDNGRTIAEEARWILRDAVERKPDSRNLGDIVRKHFGHGLRH